MPIDEDGPYKGLEPFGQDDADVFFGRERDVRLLASNAVASRVTVVYGPSGVGKSSLMNAGVAPTLRLRNQCHVLVLHNWHQLPLEQLDAALTEAAEPPPSPPPLPSGEKPAAADVQRVVVVLDQFEEYFLYRENDSRWEEALAAALDRTDIRVHLVFSIREDGLGKLDALARWVPGLFDNLYRLAHLDVQAAPQAIRGPLDKLNEGRAEGEHLAVEPGVVQAVIEQLRTDAGEGAGIETSYLQLVMQRLWEHDVHLRGGTTLTTSTLIDALGGPTAIVERHVKEKMRALPEEKQAQAAVLLRYLVSQGGTKVAMTATHLADLAELPEQTVQDILLKLTSLRILRVVPSTNGSMPFQLFHDALVDPVREWRARFDAAGRIARARREIRRKLIAGGAVVSVGAAVLSAYLWREADEQRDLAVSSGIHAEAQRLLAETQRERAIKAEQQATRARERVEDNLAFRQGVFGAKPQDVPALLAKLAQEDRISFKAELLKYPYKAIDGRPTYRFKIEPVIPAVTPPIGTITYFMRHSTFKSPLLATGPGNGFSALWDGVGCLKEVFAIVEFAPTEGTPHPLTAVRFNHCDLIARAGKESEGK